MTAASLRLIPSIVASSTGGGVETMPATQDTKTKRGEKTSIDTSNKVTKKKSVRWDRDVTMRFTTPLSKFTDDEINDTWYTPNEFNQMRRCALKVECPIARTTKVMVRRAVIYALLEEQCEQYYMNSYDDDALANVCALASIRAHREAKLCADRVLKERNMIHLTNEE